MRPLGRITSPLTLLLGIATALATSQARAQVAPANPPAASPALTRVPASPATCDEVLTRLWNGRGAFAGAPKAFAPNISSQLLPNNSSACGAAYLAAYLPTLPTDAEKKRAEELYAPARQSLLNALENYSSKQQQTSTTSSTASVSPVSKVTGLSGVAEEFSGISVNSGTSALTF